MVTKNLINLENTSVIFYLLFPWSVNHPSNPKICPLCLCLLHFWSEDLQPLIGKINIACLENSIAFALSITLRSPLVAIWLKLTVYLLSSEFGIIPFSRLHFIDEVIEDLFSFSNAFQCFHSGVILDYTICIFPLPRSRNARFTK